MPTPTLPPLDPDWGEMNQPKVGTVFPIMVAPSRKNPVPKSNVPVKFQGLPFEPVTANLSPLMATELAQSVVPDPPPQV